MAFSLYDYFFNCDPLQLNFRLLTVNGFWPPDTKNRTYQILYAIYSFVCCFSLAHIFFFEIVDIYMIREDLYNVTKNLCATTVAFGCVYKQLLLFGKVEKVRKLYVTLEAFKKSLTDPVEIDIMKTADKTISMATKVVYSFGVPCITTWMIFPALESGSQRRLPYPYRLPTDHLASPVYEVVYCYHSLSMIGFMVGLLSNDTVYHGMVLRINAEYEILVRKLRTLDKMVNSDVNGNGPGEGNERLGTLYNRDITEKTKLFVKDCTIRHQSILRKIEELQKVYGGPYLVHYVAGVIMFGSIILDVIVVSKGITLELLQRLFYSGSGIVVTYLCCYFTTQMQEQSFKLRREVYSTPWYKLSPTVRRDLLMMTMRSVKPSAVRVGGFFPLNLVTFLQFLKITYNITAVLYQTMN